MLREELTRKAEGRKQKAEKYVFPEQAQMYLENASGITWRAKKVLAAALGAKAGVPVGQCSGGSVKGSKPAAGKDQRPETRDSGGLDQVSDEEARRRGLDYIAKLGNAEKRERMRKVFELYMEGKTTKELVAAAGVSKGSTSHYLNEVEMGIGCRIVRGRPAGGSLAALLRNDSDLLRVEREGGKRRASVRDFHSFRVTWVTIALTGGVPLELVQKVTGHKTTDIVLKHYFQPGKEAFRKALSAAMPALLTNGSGAEKSLETRDQGREAVIKEMRGLIDQVKPKALRERMVKLLGRL
jgi:hypothetical protein